MSAMSELNILRLERNIPVETPRLFEVLESIAKHNGKCVFCGEKFDYSADGPYIPGQIYSAAGLQEVRIFGVCEYCFDESCEYCFDESMRDSEEECPVCGEYPQYCLGHHEKVEDES